MPPPADADARFHTTQWTMVLAASAKDTHAADAALEALCRAYWFPLYAFARRSGKSPHDAQDLTQDFFAKVLEKKLIAAADREKGRFRTFLITALKRHMVNAWEASQAQKRGGGATFVSPDHAGAEERFLADPTASPDFDAAYEHDWAMTLLDRTMVTLRKHYADLGQEAVFEKLKPCLTATRGDIPYEEMARDLGMNEGAVRTAVSRLRKKFRETFRACVADTVEDGDEVEREMSHIIGIIAGV